MPTPIAMEIPFDLIQFGVSLLAILLLAGLAYWLKLGGKPVLADEENVRKAAEEVADGFKPVRISISRSKNSAIASNASGQIMLIKRHGNQFAGRILGSQAQVREEVDALIVDPRDGHFGKVRLQLKDPGYWADRINRL